MGYSWIQFVCLLLFTGFLKENNGLKWVQVNVPQFSVPNKTVQLQCDYDLGNDTLYSVKWYKEHEEFYRYVPRSSPPANSYGVEGIYVDMSKSDSRKVVLFSVNWKTSGLFRCEVSAEAPSFASAQSEARMEIVSFPEKDPVISGVHEQYVIGDEINLNCTSGQSRPASTLHWYVNRQQILNEGVLIKYPLKYHAKGLVTNTLGLKFTLNDRHFLDGLMKIKCEASMDPELFSEDKEIVVQNASSITKDTRQALLLVKSMANQVQQRFIYIYYILVGIMIYTMF